MEETGKSWLPPSGETTSIIREYDWKNSPLGPTSTWPIALQILLRTILEYPTPTALLWGPDLITLHNHAYKPLLGSKPIAIGRPFLEVWHEAREVIAPQLNAASSGKVVRFQNVCFDLHRGEIPQEAFIDYSYSPVRDEVGTVVGVLNIATETTSRELVDRARLKADASIAEIERRFRAIVTAGAYSIFRMSPDWLTMHQLDGWSLAGKADPIENWLEKFIVEEDRHRVFKAIDDAIRTKSVFELEHRVRRGMGVRVGPYHVLFPYSATTARLLIGSARGATSQSVDGRLSFCKIMRKAAVRNLSSRFATEPLN